MVLNSCDHVGKSHDNTMTAFYTEIQDSIIYNNYINGEKNGEQVYERLEVQTDPKDVRLHARDDHNSHTKLSVH